MADAEDWSRILQDHPIFSASYQNKQNFLELSTLSLRGSENVDSSDVDSPTFGRRQTMILKDADLIVAVGKEIRMSSFGDIKLSRSTRKSYKTLHTPNLQFEICQIALNPSGKLLAVAGTHQVAVVVLPRAGYSRLVSEAIDCKCVQIGQFYHAANTSAAIAKIDWHPWGEAGSTLLVMTVDGKLREYDISADTEEPQQILSFVPEKRQKAFMAEDDSEREVASFTLGRGRADWGPLTVYAVMRSGDIYSICPYMPQNASIPSTYIYSLECFISAKQEYLTQEVSTASKNLSAVYDYQRKYVTALTKQLPPGTLFPAAPRSVLMHPPTTIKPQPLRQGPFLLQPAPRMIEGSFGGDATDIIYLAFGTDDDDIEDDGRDTERLGIVLVAYQDGKVDLFLDVEKVEARWNIKQSSGPDLPMLAVYETIDFGLVSTLKDLSTLPPDSTSLLDLLHSNHPIFLLDPLHDDTVYVYHAFGVHALDVAPVLQSLTSALRTDDEDESVLKAGLQQSVISNVQPILNTFSVERRSSSPVVAVAIPNDVYLTYSMFILTSGMRIISVPLKILRSETPSSESKVLRREDTDPASEKSKWLSCIDGTSSHVSTLASEPFLPLSLTGRFADFSTNPRLLLPQVPSGSKELTLTPDTLRFLGTSVAQITSQSRDVIMACQLLIRRVSLQQFELTRVTKKCHEVESLVEKIQGPGRAAVEARLVKVQEVQKALLARLDHLLQNLMERASPGLSEHETKWFEELKRMKEDVLGRGKYDEDSLVCRTRLLEKEHARLLPALQKLGEKEKQQGKRMAEVSRNLGFSQAFEYGERSNLDRTRIAALQNQVKKLASRVDTPLSQPSTPP